MRTLRNGPVCLFIIAYCQDMSIWISNHSQFFLENFPLMIFQKTEKKTLIFQWNFGDPITECNYKTQTIKE